MNEQFLIGIDIGGTKVYGGLVTPNGEIITTIKLPTPPKADLKIILLTIDKLINALLKDSRTSFKKVLGLGIAVPGVVDNNGYVVVTPNIKLSDTDLKKILINKYRTRVAIGNDVNLGVLGEKWLGAGRKANNIVGIFPGTGVGGGIIIDSRIVTGTHGAAAELGHLQVDPNGPMCTCGNIGCLEAFAGRWAIERDLRAGLKKLRRSFFKDLTESNIKQIKSSMLAKALKAKDPLTTRIMTSSSQALGRACVSLNHVFDPEIFLFGGGVIEACGDFILPIIEKTLKKDPFFARLSPPKVVQAKLGDDAVMLGGVALVKSECGLKESSLAYYPRIHINTAQKISVRGKIQSSSFFIRADGKVKEPKETLFWKLNDDELDDICRKGPDVLFVATPPRRKVVITPKGLKLLKKKRILPRILPRLQAINAYNTCGDRKTILFYL